MKALLFAALIVAVTHSVAGEPAEDQVTRSGIKIRKNISDANTLIVTPSGSSLAVMFPESSPIGFIIPPGKDYSFGIEYAPTESYLAWITVSKKLEFIDCIVITSDKNVWFAPPEIIAKLREREKLGKWALEKLDESLFNVGEYGQEGSAAKP